MYGVHDTTRSIRSGQLPAAHQQQRLLRYCGTRAQKVTCLRWERQRGQRDNEGRQGAAEMAQNGEEVKLKP